ncbi:hypothetical protein ACFVWF_32270 [Rhodococcus qingshengii]|uniref:hypothetical protein n=1 Tax=Rhodococcus qingshengii TaxID=334542 RepID=UPI0036DC2B4C
MPSIIPTPDKAQEVARALLEAADSPDDVRTDTSGPSLAFVVSDELATKAGFGEFDDDPESLPEPEPESESEPEPEPEPEPVETKAVNEPKTRAPRKPTTKDA